MLIGLLIWPTLPPIMTMGAANCPNSSTEPICNPTLMSALSFISLVGMISGLVITLAIGAWKVNKKESGIDAYFCMGYYHPPNAHFHKCGMERRLMIVQRGTTDTASRMAESASTPKLLFSTVYPLLAGSVLGPMGFMALFGLLYDRPGFALLFVAATVVLIGGAHFWLRRILEQRGQPDPGQLPIVLSTAMVVGLCVSGAPVLMDLGVPQPIPTPLVCLAPCLIGTFTYSRVRERGRFLSTLTGVLLAALMLTAIPWLIATTNETPQGEHALQEVSAPDPLE